MPFIFPKPVYVSSPLLPSLDDLRTELDQIWESGWITNMGEKHQLLETHLRQELNVDNVSLFNNGAIALLTALKALDLPIGSEVITTPFTFAATPHCISWNHLKPVFCDIEPATMTIDANKIESLITEKTSAIVGVHVYGFPCDVLKIQEIAHLYRLKVVYDAAHAFSTKINNVGIGNFGDISMFSFHATKLYNTVEGGCLTYNCNQLNEKIYNLRNFGIRGQEEVADIGINGKMNEIQAAIGLLNLKLYENEQKKRLNIRVMYKQSLSRIKGIRIPELSADISDSCQYYPIVVENDFPISRDQLYDKFKEYNVFVRKYFHPLCSDYLPYKNLSSAKPINLPVANDIGRKVLCLPFFSKLSSVDIDNICDIIGNVGRKN